MQIIKILGTQLKDRTKWESLGMAERYLKKRALHLALYINNYELNNAASDEGFRSFIEQAELTLWSSSDLAQTAGLKNARRHTEVENKEFLRELFHRLAKNHNGVLVVAETEEKAENLKEELLQMEDKLSILSCIGIDYQEEQPEKTVNLINGIAPAVVIARMSVKKQYFWLKDVRTMINAGMWLAMPEDMKLGYESGKPMRKLYNKIKNKIFSRKVEKYNQEVEDKKQTE